MAMSAYLVTLPAGAQGATLKNGANAMIVTAASTTQAKEIAGAYFDGDGAIWSGATATEVANADDWEGWTFKVVVLTATPKVFAYVGTSTNDTIDEIAAQLVILANADADIANAAYNTTTQTLTVASAADGLGDKKLKVEIIPPGGYSSVASLVGTIVDSGVAAAALTVVLSADADVPPKVFGAVKTT
jgi:hypothetical protein